MLTAKGSDFLERVHGIYQAWWDQEVAVNERSPRKLLPFSLPVGNYLLEEKSKNSRQIRCPGETTEPTSVAKT